MGFGLKESAARAEKSKISLPNKMKPRMCQDFILREIILMHIRLHEPPYLKNWVLF
jgi:hypothetical protein